MTTTTNCRFCTQPKPAKEHLGLPNTMATIVNERRAEFAQQEAPEMVHNSDDDEHLPLPTMEF